MFGYGFEKVRQPVNFGYSDFGYGGFNPRQVVENPGSLSAVILDYPLDVQRRVTALQERFELQLHLQIQKLGFVREKSPPRVKPPTRPHNAFHNDFPILPNEYEYKGKETGKMKVVRVIDPDDDGLFDTPWSRSEYHQLLVFTCFKDEEFVLIIRETEMNNKIEDWTSICTFMAEKRDYIICESRQMGRTLWRYCVVGNWLNRLILKGSALTWIISLIWPHKTLWWGTSFLLASCGFIIYNDTFWKDPAVNYQVVKEPYIVSRFPLSALETSDALIMQYRPHHRRWFWQKVVFYITCVRVLYMICFPAPACVCDWRAVEAVVKDNARIRKIEKNFVKPWYVRYLFPSN